MEIKCKALIVASGGITGNIPMMKELGVINTKFEDAYDEYKGHVMVTFIQSCQDGDGQKAVWEIGGKKTEIVISGDPQVPEPGISIGKNVRWLMANKRPRRKQRGITGERYKEPPQGGGVLNLL